MIGKDKPVGFEVLVAREEDRVEHRLVQQEIAHPLGDDDIEFLDRQCDVLKFAFHKRDGCVRAYAV